MRILTLDNSFYDLDHLPDEVDDMKKALLLMMALNYYLNQILKRVNQKRVNQKKVN